MKIIEEDKTSAFVELKTIDQLIYCTEKKETQAIAKNNDRNQNMPSLLPEE